MTLDPLDPTSAVVLGPFIEATYAQLRAHPGTANPATIALPAGYTPVRTIQMRDFLIGQGTSLFYGYLASGPDLQVIALRGTVTPTEWFDDLHWHPTPFTPVPNAGNVVDGFFDIYRTMTTAAPGGPASTAGIAGLVSAVDCLLR